jgi:hypothetical protein
LELDNIFFILREIIIMFFYKKSYEHVNFVLDRTNGKHLSMLLRLFVPLIEGRTCALKVVTKSNSNK